MISKTKSVSNTRLHQHASAPLLSPPLELIPSINSDNVLKHRSGNNISSRKRIHNHSLPNSTESIDDSYQRFSNNNLINTHFPIATIQQVSKSSSSSQLPSVPKQAGTFIHRLVNKFFSITNTDQNKKRSSRTKRKRMNTTLHTRITPEDSQTLLHTTSNRPPLKRRQHSKRTKNCVVCRKHRNCFSTLPSDPLNYAVESSKILNTNARSTLKRHSVLTTEPSSSLPKKRTLNQSQYQIIVSAIEVIFDALISNYQQA